MRSLKFACRYDIGPSSHGKAKTLDGSGCQNYALTPAISALDCRFPADGIENEISKMRSLKSAFRNLRFLGKSYRVAGAGFLIVSWFLLAWMGARFLIVSAPLEHADAIVLLSGSSAYVERAELAAQLYKEGRAPQIILTNDNRQGGWSNTEQRNPFFYERARWELENLGVPRSNIAVILEPVNSTYDEAELLRRYSESYRLHSVVLVTSAYHSRRALWTFRRVFANSGKEIGIQSAAPGFQTPIPTVWWLYPKGWQVVAAEYVKIAYYWLR